MFIMSLGNFGKLYTLLAYCEKPLDMIGKVPGLTNL